MSKHLRVSAPTSTDLIDEQPLRNTGRVVAVPARQLRQYIRLHELTQANRACRLTQRISTGVVRFARSRASCTTASPAEHNPWQLVDNGGLNPWRGSLVCIVVTSWDWRPVQIRQRPLYARRLVTSTPRAIADRRMHAPRSGGAGWSGGTMQ